MRVLVLGSGAKDHAVLWWFSKSCFVSELFIAQGNLCTEEIATNLPDINPASPEDVYCACVEHNIDLVFIGTEAPLFTGVVEHLSKNGIKVFGAPSKSIKLEGDRSFARAFTQRHNIPVPRNSLFGDIESLERYLRKHTGETFIIKSNSLSPSRIMLTSSDTEALLGYATMLLERGPVLLEEFVPGIAVTCTILMDNNGYLMLPITSDYTRVSHDNRTPTGGMGAICPIPMIDTLKDKIIENIVEPTLYGMKVEQLLYKGVLTFSLIINKDQEPILVDYHIRFNDPATQAMVPIIKTDLLKIIKAMEEDRVNEIELETTDQCSIAVVLASKGYPMNPELGVKIENLTNAFLMNCNEKPLVFCGAIKKGEDGIPVTTGGRNLTVVGLGDSLKEANKKAYDLIKGKRFDSLWYRDDIGNKYLQN